MHRILSLFHRVVVAVLIGTVISGAGAPASAQQEDRGKQVGTISGLLIEQISKATGLKFDVARAEGSVLGRLTLRDVRVSDARGPVATVRLIRIDWTPTALFDGNVVIRELYVSDVRLIRTPPSAPKDSGPIDLSFLRLNFGAPLDVRIDKILFERVSYAPAVFGRAGQFTLTGKARVPRDQSAIDIELRLQRESGAAPQGRVLIKLDDKAGRLNVDVDLQEAPGGLLGGQLGLRPQDDIRLSIKGDAPVSAWRGVLRFDAGPTHSARLDIRTDTRDARTRARATGFVSSPGIARAAPYLGRRVDVSLDARWGDRIEIDRLEVTGSDAELIVAGAFVPATNLIDVAFTARIDELGLLQSTTGLPISGQGILAGRATGPLTAPRLRATLRAEGLRLDRVIADAAVLTIDAQPVSADRKSGGDLAVTLDAERARIVLSDGKQQPLRALNLTIDGQQSRTPGSIGRFTIKGGFDDARLSAAATIDAVAPLRAQGTLDFTGSLPAAILRGGAVDGARLSMRFSVDQATRTGKATLSLNAERLAVGIPAIDAALRGRAKADFDGKWNGDRVEIARLDVEAGRLSLSARGAVSSAPTDRLTVTLRASDLSDLSGVAGQKLAGSGTVDVSLWRAAGGLAADAKISTEGLRLQAIRIGSVDATVIGRALDREPDLRLSAALKKGLLAGSVKGRLRVSASALRLSGLRARLNAGAIDANLTVARRTGLANGRVVARIRTLGPLLALVGQQGRGAVDVRARLRAAGPRQTATIAVNGRELRLGRGEAATRLGSLRANLAFAALNRNPALIKGGIVARKIVAGGVDVERLGVTLNPVGGATAYKINMLATLDRRRLTLASTGRIRQAGRAVRVDIATIAARYSRDRIRLTQPTRLVFAPGGFIRLSGTTLDVAGGIIRAAFTRRGAFTDARLKLERVPARLLSYARIGRIDHGSIDGQVSLRGAGTPNVDFDLAATGLRRSGVAPGDALAMTAKGSFTRARLQLNATLKPVSSAETLRVALTLPRRGAIDATVKGRTDLALLSRSGLLVNQRTSGMLIADLRLSGTEAAPIARGTVRLRDGRFVNAQSGLVLEKINLLAEGQGDRLLIRSAEAADGKDGKIRLTGAARLGRKIGYTYSFRIDATRFRVLNRENALATVDAALSIDSTQAQGIRVGGKITVREARFGLAAQLPQSLTVVDVVEINTPFELRRQAARRQSALPPPPIRFDLTVDVPGRFYVSGRGVSAEFGGNLKITGTAANPRVLGALKTVRGHVDLLGRRFVFRRGEIRFATRDLSDPLLDFLAESQAGDIKGIVTIKGSAKRPKIDITSDPELPRDEVLARVLFGKDVSKLTGLEALRLASGAATLFGSGGIDLTERIRRATGLDVIDVSSEGGSTRAVFGKYVSERVLVKVEQGLSLDDTAAGVEIKIFRNFSGEATVRSDGSARAGFKWSLDY